MRRLVTALTGLAGPGSRRAVPGQAGALGFPATIDAAEVGAKTFYRVAVSGLRAWQGAVAFKHGSAGTPGFRTPRAAQR